ncbi:MAG TPA: hypothetical protein VES95_09620 [Dermatophilaceae bacterium]|nr:hypothetical protein [Dermatophilaceae bacterium]
MIDGWWVSAVVYGVALVVERLWRLRTWRPREWPDADYGWKLFHVHWMPVSVLDVVLAVPLVLSLLFALLAEDV